MYLGYWFSFISTTILFALIGCIFGVPKCSRLMNNIFWYDTSLKKRFIRVVIASLLLVPSWIFLVYFNDIMVKINSSAVFFNEYIIHGVHFFLPHYLIFGLSPYYIFGKLGLTNTTVSYAVIGDS